MVSNTTERNDTKKKKIIHSLDRHTRKPVDFERSDIHAISPVSDLDLSFVNRVLYSSDAK
jgi:hypothetical protein